MGLFNKQQPTKKPTADPGDDQNFFDEYFREELRNRGRWHFEKVISENADLFKQDLDATITHLHQELKDRIVKEVEAAVAQINTDVRTQVTTQLTTQLAEYRQTLDDTKATAVEALNHGKQALEQQQQELATSLKQSMQQQELAMQDVFRDSKTRMDEMTSAQAAALTWLNQNIDELKNQQQQLNDALQRNIAQQKELLTRALEDNMARIVEQYLLQAVGDQYDMKSQLPAIMQQLEANKQAMKDDMSL